LLRRFAFYDARYNKGEREPDDKETLVFLKIEVLCRNWLDINRAPGVEKSLWKTPHLSKLTRRSELIQLLLFFIVQTAFAGSATWNLNPTSSDWNTAANWTPPTAPNGPTDVATFQASNTTHVFLSDWTEVDRITFDPGANAYAIIVDSAQVLTLSGEGIINLSDHMQQFIAVPVLAGKIVFFNNASAGTRTLFRNESSDRNTASTVTQFFDNSSAGGGTFVNEGGTALNSFGGHIEFRGSSNAGDAVFINLSGVNRGYSGVVIFYDSSNAMNGTFTNEAGDAYPFSGSATIFYNTSSAAQARCFNRGAANEGEATGGTYFFGTSTAAQSVVTSEAGRVSGAAAGFVKFEETSTADGATLIAKGGPGDGGQILFLDSSDGGKARVEVFGNGSLTIASHLGGGITIGSLEGDGLVFLGENRLTIGSNGSDQLFAGIISDSGSIKKIGAGTLILMGANTYSGGTVVHAGRLFVANSSESGTGSGLVRVEAGALGGSGTIGSAALVGNRNTSGAVLELGGLDETPTTLVIEDKLTLQSGATYRVMLDSSLSQADKVVANGIEIHGARISFSDQSSHSLPPGTVFMVIDNTAATSISGAFGNLSDGSSVTIGVNTFEADYEGGDGNDLTLTAVP
jgi:autotransporter-associated beta strand protein